MTLAVHCIFTVDYILQMYANVGENPTSSNNLLVLSLARR